MHITTIVGQAVDIIFKYLEGLANGTRKAILCSWWLSYIETRVDKFLSSHGYVHDSLPFNYTDVPPADMIAVQRNHSVLTKLLKDESGELSSLIIKLTQKIYQILNPFKHDLEVFVREKWWVFLQNPEEAQIKVQKVLDDMNEMKRMDEDVLNGCVGEKKGKIEMTQIVPISGLVMARFSVYECELRTSIEIWGGERQKKSHYNGILFQFWLKNIS
jgi:hypothetical protein